MPLPKQKFRELVFLSLYAKDFDPNHESELHQAQLMKELKVSKKYVLSAVQEAEKIFCMCPQFDTIIQTVGALAQFKTVERVEKNILRLAFFAFFFDKELPSKVVLSEAIRLAKKFSTSAGASFINAFLDIVYKKIVKERDDLSIQEGMQNLKEWEEGQNSSTHSDEGSDA
jgi:N utilization substance protein B